MKSGCTCQLHQLIDAEAQWPHQLLINLGGLFLRPAGSRVPMQLIAHACKIIMRTGSQVCGLCHACYCTMCGQLLGAGQPSWG